MLANTTTDPQPLNISIEKHAAVNRPANIGPIPFIIDPPREASPFIDALCSDRTVLFNAIDILVKNIQQNIFDIAIMIIKRENVDHNKPSDGDDVLVVVSCKTNDTGMKNTGRKPKMQPIQRLLYNPVLSTVLTYMIYCDDAKTIPDIDRI